jgi:rfaE bifunctional protein nucleotidyltransferase chain/domain
LEGLREGQLRLNSMLGEHSRATRGAAIGQVITQELLLPIVRERQQNGERAVFTNGCFDLLHIGHVTYLRRARELGDFLIVAVNSDDSTRLLKGQERPLVPERERAEVLAALALVDYVTIFADSTAGRLVDTLRPSVYVKGADYAGSESTDDFFLSPDALRRLLRGDSGEYPELAHIAASLPEAEVVASYGAQLALLAYLPGHSTTALIHQIVSRYAHSKAPQAGAGQRRSRS